MAIVNKIRYHETIKYSFAHEIAKENLSFHVLLTVMFPKNIQSNFTQILPLKEIDMTIAAVNYIRQYQLNFR